jgi:protein TonB
MNRLQKKCAIATVGIHLLLLAILIVGPAFYNPQPKPEKTQVLDVISPNLIDAAFNVGRKDATPPPPAPAPAVTLPPPQLVPPTPQVQIPPTQPKPVEPKPTLAESLEKIFKPEPKPEPAKPAPVKPEPKRHEIQVNTQRVTRVATRNSTPNPTAASKPDNSKAIASAIKNLRQKLSPGMVVDVPGVSTVAYSSYRDALATIYYNAWVTPEGVANDEADTIVKIIIARDGTVVSSRIVTASGNAKIDDSVRRALNRVSFVAPLPDQSKSEQEFNLDFNLKTKQSLE